MSGRRSKAVFILGILALSLILIIFTKVKVEYSLSRSPKEEDSSNLVRSGEVVVNMTANGYIPHELRIYAGTKVRFVNTDSIGHWPASDFHPSHTLYPDFDPKRLIKPQEEWSFIFTKVGEWGMHDHLSPYETGKILVEETAK